MAADGESTGKSKGRAGRRDEVDINERVRQARRLAANEPETISTMVPREGDGYRLPVSGSAGQALGRIDELGSALTDDDLRRVNNVVGSRHNESGFVLAFPDSFAVAFLLSFLTLPAQDSPLLQAQ